MQSGHTVYKDNNVYKEYDINMSSDKKEVIDCSEPQLSDRQENRNRSEIYQYKYINCGEYGL